MNGSLLTITGAGQIAVTASQVGNATFAAATPVMQSFTVYQATPVITWATPAAIIYPTALGATQLDASSPVAGTFTYSPPAGSMRKRDRKLIA